MTQKRPTSFGKDIRGNVATIFALSLIPLMGFTGLATDYAKSVLVKRRLELAIDSAALAAVRRTVEIINDGNQTQAQAIAAGEREGKAYLAAQAVRIVDASLNSSDVTVTIKGEVVSSETRYDASVPTVFAQLFDVERFQVGGSSGASVTLPPYVNVHVLVDISQSMGIGATAVDQEIIRNMQVRRFNGGGSWVGSNGCAFGCHILQSEFKSNNPAYPTKSTYQMAHENGARMRIDVVRDAVGKLANSLLQREDKRYQVALHTFHSSFNTPLELTDSASKAEAAIGNLGPSTREGGTNAHVAFKQLQGIIGTPGDGLTRLKAKAIVVVMTDGTEDTQMEYPDRDGITWDPNFVYFEPTAGDWGGRIQSFDPGMCAPLKTRGVRVIALNTKYLIPVGDSNPKFTAIRDWLYWYIENNMAKCVSGDGDYYDASSPADINRAIDQIISSISKPLALTH
ncbi:TadE/TadG family type IV pilus assembly protein [Aureimonas phyllosphaerae]|uniref:Flp pilus assembly protein TadG n=1 Tax=Aureimonas phyllosphaerae TaxID=1166078 RepID=A0A7W6BV49_9HYPH|nr:pilus assembly protein TadG-related protein [Aureimonas phyllosphaerae]MBB3936639.1 Flp pilus assembly protein TadG [Aureimonas phyllosphaerae]MBB3960497.1 Flp pilus assembly protein TadG [Aureimonas phyllosphaerae]SFF23819.1 Flp pilus assembly protein TadG [Aureimonas phyllosphaerae]